MRILLIIIGAFIIGGVIAVFFGSANNEKDIDNPDGDISIEFTGLRPAEKLYEELLIGSDVSGTEHPRILRANEEKIPAWGHQADQILHSVPADAFVDSEFFDQCQLIPFYGRYILHSPIDRPPPRQRTTHWLHQHVVSKYHPVRFATSGILRG